LPLSSDGSIVFLRKDAAVHCGMPASAGHASIERLFRHRKPAGPIFQHRYDRSEFQRGREHPF
jgi:hypothetical protein